MKKLTPIIDMIEHGNSKGALDALEKLRDEDREKSKCVEEIDMEEHISDFTKVWIRLDNFQRETITDALKISEAQNTERVRKEGVMDMYKEAMQKHEDCSWQKDCENICDCGADDYNKWLYTKVENLTTPDHE